MVVSRYRKWRRLSLGLVVLVLVGTLSLLSHLWTSTPGGQKDLLHQDYLSADGIPLRNNNDHADPGHNSGRHDNNQPVATQHDENETPIAQDDKNAVPLIDNKNTVPLDDNQPAAVPRDKPQGGNHPDDNQPDDNRPDAVPPDDNKTADRLEDRHSDGVQLDDKSPNESLPEEENKTNAAQLGNNKPAVLEDTFQPDSVPRDLKHPDSVPRDVNHPDSVPRDVNHPDSVPRDVKRPDSVPMIRQNIGTSLNHDLFDQVHDEERYFQNSTFQLEKGYEKEGNEFDQDSFFDGVKNEMNQNDFAADANQNADIPLPTKSAFPKTDGDGLRAGSSSNDEFDSGIKFARQNLSNSSGSFGTSDVVKTVSMSLYGSEPRYTMGAIRNAELVKENFPGWTLRIYMESPASSAPRFGPVPRNIVEKLRSLGADIHYIVPEQDFIPPMMWRFLVADDLSVDCFIIRDSDSRLTERDAAAVSAWIRSGKPFHSIRDHPSHASYAVSGGLWGGRTKDLRDILRRSWIDLMRGTSSNYLEDMNFLNGVVWPRVQHHAYCSDSVSCDRWPNSHPFPIVRYGYDHVGQVFNEHDLGRPVDIRILRVAGENARCAPTDGS